MAVDEVDKSRDGWLEKELQKPTCVGCLFSLLLRHIGCRILGLRGRWNSEAGNLLRVDTLVQHLDWDDPCVLFLSPKFRKCERKRSKSR